MDLKETLDQDAGRRPVARKRPLPGLVAVFSAGRPVLAALPLRGEPLTIGRGMEAAGETFGDPCLSRKHAEVGFDGRRWTVRDLGSRNGTAVDGAQVTGKVEAGEPRLLRTGDTLWLFSADVGPFLLAGMERRDGLLLGPTTRPVFAQIDVARRGGDTLHITGETGAGKELAARAFHGGQGPFVPVNCATISESLAERLLFGAKKGAFSGADADADGFVQAADGGTLFLDEVAELSLPVQAKLLRVLEAREVTPLGASRARKVTLRLCSATHAGLRDRVAEGRFREDLYFRIGRPAVALPPLRERLEELPWHLCALAEADARTVHSSLVEAALLRHWPGNVRELIIEGREALRLARGDGRTRIEARDLSPQAGALSATGGFATPVTPAAPPDREAVEAALRSEGGNVTRAAAALGLHRNQLRRLVEKLGIDPRAFAAAGAAEDADDEADAGEG